MTKLELAKKVFKISHLTGTFKLRSGLVSNEYFDKYRFESNPEILIEIAKQLAPLIPPETEILAALEMGGIPIGTALSIVTGKPIVFVRKKPKDYGTCKFAEGLDIKNKNLCIIEDVITTGGQVVLSAQDLRQDGAIVNNVLCVIDRGSESKKKLSEGAQLNLIPLFTHEELKSAEKN